jgi:Fe-S cluster assembly protein SufD
LKPNCSSYQKIKNVLNKNCKSAFQGKIFVKDIAQKTDAYKLSKALILNDTSEFSAKPELEIYADDVKCSHGSTSGSISQDSIYYLMTRGINKKNAIELLTKAFLNEVISNIKSVEIKKFIEKNLDRQIYEH